MNNSKCCGSKIKKDYLNNSRCENCLLICEKKTTFRLFYIILFSLVFLGFTVIGNKSTMPKYIVSNKVDTCDIKLDKDSIFKEMLCDSIWFPEYALKSCLYETNNLQSTLSKDFNNLFGMIYIASKYQDSFIVVGDYKFATYKTRKRSILDYKRLQKAYGYSIDSKYCLNERNYTEKLIKAK